MTGQEWWRDPSLERAAEAGDVQAMRTLGKRLAEYRPEECQTFGVRWLLAAAEAGDPEAMHCLSDFYVRRVWSGAPTDGDDAAQADHWCRLAAEAGWPAAMRSWAVREGASVSEQEVWLRRAVDGGDTFAIVLLGQLAEEQGVFDDAEYWYRLAYDRNESGAGDRLSNLFRRRGRLSEAVAFFRPGAERGSSADTWQLVIALKEMGREQEAATWRELYDRQYVDEHGRSAPSQSGITIAVAAVVTTAVMPFIQTLVAKVAEDTYEQARGLVRRMLRRGETSPPRAQTSDDSAADDSSADDSSANGSAADDDGQPRLLIADDTETGITLYLWSDASDEALRALSSLDMDELTARRPDQGRVRVVWHPETGTWHVRGE